MVRKGISAWQARFYMGDMLRALHYCHQVVGVFHKDIKPENIVVGHDTEAVLIDFGVSNMLDEAVRVGTLLYHAPELFDNEENPYGEATDVWALGLTFYCLLTGRHPFEDCINVKDL